MAFKLVAIAALFAITSASPLSYHDGHQSAHGHAVSYSSVSHGAPAHGHGQVAHTYAAPALHTYHAPAVHTYAAPVVAKVAVAPAVYSHHHAAPVYTHHHAAPVYAHHHAAPVVTKVAVAPVYAHHHHEEEHHAPAHYQFEYSVHDPHTHDIKEQKEERNGDVVKGMYSLIEPDGSKRIVEYTADKHNGFNAVVHRQPAAHPIAVKAPVAKIAVAPVAKVAAVAAPVHYYHH